MITGWVNRCAHQFENHISLALPTAREDLMLPQEHLMGWAVAEMQCLIYPGDANVFVWNAEHRNPRDVLREPEGNQQYDSCQCGCADDYCALPLSPWQAFLGTSAVSYSVELQQFVDTAVVYE
jgi:hypothetical protein